MHFDNLKTRPLDICFVTNGMAFNGNSLEESLGGSETALLCMARDLAALGNNVTVFCNCSCDGWYDGVQYNHVNNFARVTENQYFDVLVASRWCEYLVTPARAGWRVLWLHDTIVKADRYNAMLWQTDEMFLLSDFHIENYLEDDKNNLRHFKDFFWKTSNGVDKDLCEAARLNTEKVPNKLIYISRPERGLAFALQEVMPRIWNEIPDATFNFCSYTFQEQGMPDHVVQPQRFAQEMAERFPGKVKCLGSLNKKDLYREIASSAAMIYPTGFPEIFGIGPGLEAPACGTPVVTTNKFALAEVVKHKETGILIDEKPYTEKYAIKFANETIKLLKDEAARERYYEEAPKSVAQNQRYWSQIAATWDQHFREKLHERATKNSAKVVDNLVLHNDLLPAIALADESRAKELTSRKEEVLENAILKTTEEIKAKVKEQEESYLSFAKLLKSQEVKADLILELLADDASWTLQAGAALFPNAKFKIFASTKGAEERLKQYVKLADLDHRIEVELFSEEAVENTKVKSDLTIVQALELQEEPHELLQFAYDNTKLDGHVGFFANCGSLAHRLRDVKHTAFWNFNQIDFREMFKDDISLMPLVGCRKPDIHGFERKIQWSGILSVYDKSFKFGKLEAVSRTSERPYQSVVACIIAYNEEDWVTRCMKHLRPYVDRISITLDSKTTDKTRELADAYVDEWRIRDFDNFQNQRNFSIQNHDEDWIFWIDVDEMLTEGQHCKRYLESPMYNGFTMRQCHLQLDVHGNYDLPIRLFRNQPYYRFIGAIHEQPIDTRRGVNSTIDLTIPIFETNLAHYGYPIERQRRHKCANRNLRLLLEDIELNPDRKLNKLLAMRDYLNILKWREVYKGQNAKNIRPNSLEHHCLNAALAIYLEFFYNPQDKAFQSSVMPMAQDAMAILSEAGLPFLGCETPPFYFSYSFGFGIAQVDESKLNDKPVVRWCLNQTDFDNFVNSVRDASTNVSGGKKRGKFKKIKSYFHPKMYDLLKVAVGAIDPKSGDFNPQKVLNNG